MKPVPLAFALLLAACGHDHGHEFENLPDCVVDHMDLGEAMSIAHCLVGKLGMQLGEVDQAACEDWVAANGGYETSRAEACTLYFQETGD